MRWLIKSDFLWRFIAGFALGAAAVGMMAPASAVTLIDHVAHVHR